MWTPLDYVPKSIAGFDCLRESEGYVFDFERANAPIEFAHTVFVHIKGKLGGQHFEMTKEQKEIVGTFFGWIDPVTKLRRFRTLAYFAPRVWSHYV